MTSITPPVSNFTTLNGAVNDQSHDDGDSSHRMLENDLLITALHATQEKLERTSIELSEKKLEIMTLASKLERLYKRFPNYWDAVSISYTVSEEIAGQRKITWTVCDSELGNNFYKLIKFETAIHDGVTSIKFLKGSQGLNHFKSNPNLSVLNCLPVNGSYAAENNKCISSIGTTDWKAIKDLAKKLQFALANNEFPEIPKDYSAALANGLTTLRNVFDKWPKVLRYDTIELTNNIKSEEYQALDIKITNLEIESLKVPELCYRISSVNEPGKPFGQFPRLEFGKDTVDIFENWFKETSDHRGDRLELRFADPDQMDIATWKKLSQRDQLLVAGNISVLPQALKELKIHAKNSLDWSAWEKLSTKLKNILAATLKKH